MYTVGQHVLFAGKHIVQIVNLWSFFASIYIYYDNS